MDLPEAIEEIRAAIVQVRGAIDAPLGTGFLVDEGGHVVTAKHVLDAGRALAQQFRLPALFRLALAAPNVVADGVRISSTFFLADGDVLDEDDTHNLALLRMRPNPFVDPMPQLVEIGEERYGFLYGVARLADRRPRDGEVVGVSGYPLLNNALVTNSGSIASAWLTESSVDAPDQAAEFEFRATVEAPMLRVYERAAAVGIPTEPLDQVRWRISAGATNGGSRLSVRRHFGEELLPAVDDAANAAGAPAELRQLRDEARRVLDVLEAFMGAHQPTQMPPLVPTEPADRYLADLEVNGGNSGGPVYRLTDAAVIGVCVATQTAPGSVRRRGGRAGRCVRTTPCV
jgi:hypothetical protein